MLPTDAKARKDIPIYSGFIKYFPDAIAAVAELSRKGNDQHNPGKPLAWDRSKSGDELDAQLRHICDMAGGTEADTDGVLHATKNAWRAMAHLQKLLEAKKPMTATEAWARRVWPVQTPLEAAETRTQSIPAAEREPMTAEEEAIKVEEYPPQKARATRWLMRRYNGKYCYTAQRLTPARADRLARVTRAVPVCRIED